MAISDNPLTDQEFREALTDLVLTARGNGIEITGGWPIDGGEAPTDFDVEICRVVKDRQAGR